MKRWHAPRTIDSFLSVLGAIGLIAAAGVGLLRLIREAQGPIDTWPITITWFSIVVGCLLALALAAALLWRALQAGSLGYSLDRNAITINQRGRRYIIPLDQIDMVRYAETSALPRDRAQVHFGRGQPNQTLYITTSSATYVLAVAQRERFTHELDQRLRLGASQTLHEGPIYRYQRLTTFARSVIVQRLTVLGVLINLLIWAVLAWRFTALPDTVPIRYDPLGGTAGTRSRGYTLLLPTVASAVWLANLIVAAMLYARSRLASELLLLGTVIAQIVSLVAVWFLVRGV